MKNREDKECKNFFFKVTKYYLKGSKSRQMCSESLILCNPILVIISFSGSYFQGLNTNSFKQYEDVKTQNQNLNLLILWDYLVKIASIINL